MKAYSVDLRQKIITVHATEDISQRQLAERFQVSLSTIHRYLKRVRNGADLEPKAHGGGNRAKLTPAQLDRVARLIESNNDVTLAALMPPPAASPTTSYSTAFAAQLDHWAASSLSESKYFELIG